ncbi:YHYH domain-containing protein [Budvicia diplopodorum]|nr:YHYH domain-containing protein [Budvicia diplopodorum]
MKKLFLLCFTALIFFPYGTFAHSGGTDSNGCHTNHKTGEYHCHNRK